MKVRLTEGFVGIIIIMTVFGGAGCKVDDKIYIYWSDRAGYDSKVDEFNITVEMAHELVVSKTMDHPERYITKKPIFVTDDGYFFSEPLKRSISIQGFYVNGSTGVVEYRESIVHIKPGAKSISINDFSSIERME